MTATGAHTLTSPRRCGSGGPSDLATMDPADFDRVIIAPPYPAEVADTYSARCAGPQGITVLDAFECWHYQHGLRHMGEIELARGFLGLGGMTA